MTEAFATTDNGRSLTFYQYVCAVHDTLPMGPHGFLLELKFDRQCSEDDEGYCDCFAYFPCDCEPCREVKRERGFVCGGGTWDAIMSVPDAELMQPEDVALYV